MRPVTRLSTGQRGWILERSAANRHEFVVAGRNFSGVEHWPDWDMYEHAPWWWHLRHPIYSIRARRD